MSCSGCTSQSRDTEIPCAALPATTSHVQLSLLDGGSFMAEYGKIHAGVENEVFRMYNWAFHISHNGRNVLWDLGMTEDASYYTPWVRKHMLATVYPVGPRKPLVEQLRQRGSGSHQIDTVLFSHAHWDHCRPIRDTFPNATALFGPGTKEGCSPGHMADPALQWDGRFFDPHNSTENWKELEGPWIPFGPFENAVDFFGDGSFWVIQAPGHMDGNLCAAAKIESGDWILLGSDCCHSRLLLDGAFEIAKFGAPDGSETSLHADIPAAAGTIARIRLVEKQFGFHIALSHDASWLKEGTDAVLMSILDDDMKLAARERIPKDERP